MGGSDGRRRATAAVSAADDTFRRRPPRGVCGRSPVVPGGARVHGGAHSGYSWQYRIMIRDRSSETGPE